MVRNFFIALLSFATAGVFAQEGTASPYSYYGLGENRQGNTIEYEMMAGVSVFADSIHVNLKNPAAYAKLGVTAGDDFGVTVYTAGASRNAYRLDTASDREGTSVVNLDYLALAFSLGRGFGMGFGIMPYSSVGYNFIDEQPGAERPLTNVFEGEGGLSKVYVSMGYEPIKNLSIGATANYSYGTLDSERLQQIEDVQFGTFDRRSSQVNGFDFNFGLNYSPTFENGNTLVASLRLNTQGNLVSRNTQSIGSFSVATGTDIEVNDLDLDARGLRNTEFKVPTATTVGLGYGKRRQWFLAAEFTEQDFSDFENAFLGVGSIEYQAASSYAKGGFFIPDHTSFTSYLKRMTYRAGFRFQETGMVINDTDINNLGITFGVGLPLGRSLSNINIGFELGRRGTTNNDLVQEDYFKVNLGLSLNDLWFRKRKIN